MIYALGVVLIGGHFLACAAVATFLSEHQSSWSLLLLLAYAAATGLLVTKLQAKLEMIMISRHITKKPGSSWRVLATKSSGQEPSKA